VSALAATRGASPSATDRLDGLAAVARRSVEADATAILALSLAGDVAVLGASGLTAAERADLVAALRAGQAPLAGGRGSGVAGFGAVARSDVTTADGAVVALYALRRGDGPVADEQLLRAVVAHAARATELGAPQRPPRPPADRPSAGPPPLLYAGGLGYEEFIAAVRRDVVAAIGPSTVGVHVWDDDKQILQMVPGSFAADPELIALGRMAPDDARSSVARVFATGLPYLTNAVVGDPGVLEELAAPLGLQRLLVLPLYADGRAVGVLQVADKDGDFTAADVRALAPLLDTVAQALMFTRVRAQLLRRQRLDALLIDVAINVASGRSLQDFLGDAFAELCLAAYAAAVAIVPVEGEPRIWRQDDVEPAVERMFVADARRATVERAWVVAPSCAGDPGWAAVETPLRAAGARVGTLAALRHYGVAFNRDERRTLSQFASLIALAWATEDYQHQRAVVARELERQRIGDVLHDQIAQLLFAARLHIEAAARTPDVPAAAAASVSHARALNVRAERAVRTVIADLSSATSETLPELLAGVVAAVEDEFGRSVKLEIALAAAVAAPRLGRSAADVLAKVTREALINAAKHAGPCQLSVRLLLTARNRVLLAVADDGIGARPGADGHGLASLRRAVRRHAGTLRVHVGDTGGTTVTVSLPL
jgi:signal transduction histidine kinase